MPCPECPIRLWVAEDCSLALPRPHERPEASIEARADGFKIGKKAAEELGKRQKESKETSAHTNAIYDDDDQHFGFVVLKMSYSLAVQQAAQGDQGDDDDVLGHPLAGLAARGSRVDALGGKTAGCEAASEAVHLEGSWAG